MQSTVTLDDCVKRLRESGRSYVVLGYFPHDMVMSLDRMPRALPELEAAAERHGLFIRRLAHGRPDPTGRDRMWEIVLLSSRPDLPVNAEANVLELLDELGSVSRVIDGPA